MGFVDVFSRFGGALSVYVLTIVWVVILGFMHFTWRCGICGKLNRTGFLKFAIQMCDHQGPWQV